MKSTGKFLWGEDIPPCFFNLLAVVQGIYYAIFCPWATATVNIPAEGRMPV